MNDTHNPFPFPEDAGAWAARGWTWLRQRWHLYGEPMTAGRPVELRGDGRDSAWLLGRIETQDEGRTLLFCFQPEEALEDFSIIIRPNFIVRFPQPKPPRPEEPRLLAWVTMRGDDTVIDGVTSNPNRFSTAHYLQADDHGNITWANDDQLYRLTSRGLKTACGRRVPRPDDCLGYLLPGSPEWGAVYHCKTCFKIAGGPRHV